MQKTFCDVCGTEIPDAGELETVEIKGTTLTEKPFAFEMQTEDEVNFHVWCFWSFLITYASARISELDTVKEATKALSHEG